MDTQVIVIDEHNIDADKIRAAGKIIRDGGLVAFPTETVYGLGGDGLNPESSKRIYAAKGRPSDNPLIIHIARLEDLYPIVTEVTEDVLRLAEAFWPGPLTMILPKSDRVPYETTGGLDTVAVRMPEHKTALAFIEAAGGYVAAPSANTSGKPSPTLATHVIDDMQGRIDMIIDGGAVGIGLESTIVDMTEEVPMILRPGYITQEMLYKVLGEVTMDKTLMGTDTKEAPKAPGMKYKHYAPKGDLTIVEGSEEAVIQQINALICKGQARGERVGVIATKETMDYYKADVIKCAGSRQCEEEIAHGLYAILREFDDDEVTLIYSESFKSLGMGQAIMNRLLKAAGYQVIHAE